MDEDDYQKRAADREKKKEAASVAPADIEGLTSDEVIRRKEELARLNKEQLDDFKDHHDVPSSPKDGTENSDAG